MTLNWVVTYEIVTPDSAEDCEAEETGIELETTNLGEAVRAFGEYAIEADVWPISPTRTPRWFISDHNHDYRTGEETTYSLHIPESVTNASRIRLARLLGLKVRK